ncbi:hypothetical protein LTR17_007546 [Elasticomyces elasticus]|nr:hypothetical protein LTR17_007546 [Elasticomyces elasticus]
MAVTEPSFVFIGARRVPSNYSATSNGTSNKTNSSQRINRKFNKFTEFIKTQCRRIREADERSRIKSARRAIQSPWDEYEPIEKTPREEAEELMAIWRSRNFQVATLGMRARAAMEAKAEREEALRMGY